MVGKKKILVICGPTAVGKTDLAITIAKKFSGQLIAADSRQVYKGLDIGTGKYSPNDTYKKFSGKWLLNGVWIHGYDLTEPGKQFTAADFAKFFAKTVGKIWSLGKLPILVGGTGFYLQAALLGFETLGIPPNPKLRRKLGKLSKEELFEILSKIDKKKAASLSPAERQNQRRLIRAIEVANFAKLHKSFTNTYPYIKTKKFDALKIGLNCQRKVLYQRIDRRLDMRMGMGMISEVKNLLKNTANPNWLESLGLEYHWITNYLLGKIDYEEMVKRLRGAIHNFARRQLTWFKKDKEIVWFDIIDKNYNLKVEKLVEKWYDKKLKI